MRKAILPFLLLATLGDIAFGADAIVTIKTNHENAIFRCGEMSTFEISVTDANKVAVTSGTLKVVLKRDDNDVVSTSNFDLSLAKPMTVNGTLETPGFIHCWAYYSGQLVGRAWIAAGFDPNKIQPATRFPNDFRTWWDGERKKLSSVPLDVQLEPVGDFDTKQAAGYRISVMSANGERVYGFLAVPAGTGPFPALVIFPGAGSGFGGPSCQEAASRKALVLSMNVHKYPVPSKGDEAEKALKDYLANISAKSIFNQGYKDPRTYHFYSIFLGFDRAIDYVMSRPDWDRKTLVVSGSSQGGWLALVMAGMKNDVVTAATAGVPFMGDLGRTHHHGGEVLRDLITAEGADATIPYYAGVNFARFVKCPVIVSVGYCDGSCFPSSVYSVYNIIPSDNKKLYVDPLAGHGLTQEYRDAQTKFLAEHLKVK